MDITLARANLFFQVQLNGRNSACILLIRKCHFVLQIKLRLMPYKDIVLLLWTKQAKILFIYVFDNVASKFYFMFMALTRWQKIL